MDIQKDIEVDVDIQIERQIDGYILCITISIVRLIDIYVEIIYDLPPQNRDSEKNKFFIFNSTKSVEDG